MNKFCKFNCEHIKKLKLAISVLKKENEMLKKDNLLKEYNVYNRHYLEELLKEEYYYKLKNKKDWFYNITLIDINNLHNINREKSYEEGDLYIKKIVKQIKNEMEKNNVSGRIFRIGGDELIVIYQPYDYIDFDVIDNITYSNGTFSLEHTFKDVIKELDKNIIELKKKLKNKRV